MNEVPVMAIVDDDVADSRSLNRLVRSAGYLVETAHDDTPTRERIEKSGAAGHPRKPFDERAALDAIRRAGGVDGGGA